MAVDEASFISSNLSSGQYDDETHVMTIEFLSGMSYAYSGVPEDVWMALKTAASPGRFMLDHVKNRYPYEQV